MKEIEGHLDARGQRFALVASRFNDLIVEKLVQGARAMLLKLGARDDDLTTYWVPGAFEIPPVATRLARGGQYSAVICLGTVIRGATPHFDYVAGAAARGIAAASQESPVPVVFGVLTTETIEQALERAGSKSGNKGAEAAETAVEMVQLYRRLDQPPGP